MRLITTKELRAAYNKKIKEIAETKSPYDIAVSAGITEPTVNNALNYPERVKLETLEHIIKSN